jgi:hypothetical protein
VILLYYQDIVNLTKDREASFPFLERELGGIMLIISCFGGLGRTEVILMHCLNKKAVEVTMKVLWVSAVYALTRCYERQQRMSRAFQFRQVGISMSVSCIKVTSSRQKLT